VPWSGVHAQVSFLDVAHSENQIRPMFRLTLLLSKGILRDTKIRRNAMLWLMGAALVMLFLGSLLLSDEWAREHPWLFFAYWAACGWLTLTGVLLALLDILVIRAAARVMQRRMEQEIARVDREGK
jgi:hypothetical protein